MRRNLTLAATLAAVALAGPALAQDAERFRLERTDDGYVRMDTKTGAMSICRERQGQLVCTLAADERTAYEDDVAVLRERLKALEDRVATLETGGSKADIPSEEEFDETLGLMEKFMRRFMGIVKDFEKEEKAPDTGKPAPDRT
ncbi:hypothetical protein NA8A_02410 [Nitratireductor indicus C115]|uniref:Uncharacterized protein n=1 Tax=Nitratireductor indicus C115 TaxID=1231190 RepID=K2NAB4_9HYPH|nr:hypothetical protein [Nitratireductor indicus]EKF44558.1 hypothetical protein NA8A_02410 [Nitratireductor indicus C115]SFQ31335.1 hypothetical protein SAMN05216176_102486 [Nitratireductor indicus]